jgi:hypothetical protein
LGGLKFILVSVKLCVRKKESLKPHLVSLNNSETFPTRKSTKQKETQVADMKTLAKIILIVTTYVFLVEKKPLLN